MGLSYYFQRMLRLEYKSMVVLLVCLPPVLFLPAPVGFIKAGIFTGLLQMMVVMLAGKVSSELAHRFPGNNKLVKAISVLFSPQPQRSIGALLTGIVSFIGLVFLVCREEWNVFHLTSVTAAFLGAASLVLILSRLTGFRPNSIRAGYRLNNEQVDIFIGTLLGSLFLGAASVPVSGFKEQVLDFGALLVPLLMGTGSLVVTYAGALLLETKVSKHRLSVHLISTGASLILLLWVAFLIPFLLPMAWVKNGQEYTAEQLVFVVQVAIAGGLVASHLIKVYKFVAKRYVDYVVYQPFKGVVLNLFFRLLINGVIATLPIVIVIGIVLFAFYNCSLYGVALALLGMVSNVGAGLVIDTNRLLSRNLSHLSGAAKRKFMLLSPTFEQFFSQNIRKQL